MENSHKLKIKRSHVIRNIERLNRDLRIAEERVRDLDKKIAAALKIEK